MATALPPVRTGPSLRIAEMAITNFRTFRERTVIPFRADRIATFHGGNGSGKSNALAALDLLFRIAQVVSEAGPLQLNWADPAEGARFQLPLSQRDRSVGATGPTEIEAHFDDGKLGVMRAVLTPKDGYVFVTSQLPAAVDEQRQLASALLAPFGPGSRPVAILDARRRATWLSQGNLVEELFNHRTSLEISRRERWRSFVDLLAEFPMFGGKEISVDRVQANAPPELFFEERGKSVLRLPELSSGEQQIVLLCAAILVANAAIVAVEEPELSIDAKNQQILRDVLDRAVAAGTVDQIILESHVPAFDGSSVIRFHRDPGGDTTVTREPTVSAEATALAEKAVAHGAKPQWVTAEGYTQLPDVMRNDLEVGAGKHIWFLKEKGRWEAWPEAELDELFGGGEEKKR